MATEEANEQTQTTSTQETKDLADAHTERLVEAGLLAECEAEVYVLRDHLLLREEYIADRLGISLSQVDDALQAAHQRLESARNTQSVIDDLIAEQEYPRRLDNIDTVHTDGFDVGKIEPIVAVLSQIVRDEMGDKLPEPGDEGHIEAVDDAVWIHIEHMSQEALYREVKQTDFYYSDDATDMLNPRWKPMSERAFAATRDFFSSDETETASS